MKCEYRFFVKVKNNIEKYAINSYKNKNIQINIRYCKTCTDQFVPFQILSI